MYYVILFLIPFIIPVTWLRQMKYFAVTNTIASGLVGVLRSLRHGRKRPDFHAFRPFEPLFSPV